MEKKHERREAIIDLLLNRAALKQDVADYSEGVFESFKVVVQDEIEELRKSVDDSRIRLSFEDKGKYEFQVYIGSDTLVFQLHPNIFRFDDENPIWQSEYLKENGANGFFGVIQIFNFLAESMEQNRMNDVGYLIGRMFMNHNYHFMLEGKGPLGTAFVDLEKSVLKRPIRLVVRTPGFHPGNRSSILLWAAKVPSKSDVFRVKSISDLVSRAHIEIVGPFV